jgi:hypothetical protein
MTGSAISGSRFAAIHPIAAPQKFRERLPENARVSEALQDLD